MPLFTTSDRGGVQFTSGEVPSGARRISQAEADRIRREQEEISPAERRREIEQARGRDLARQQETGLTFSERLAAQSRKRSSFATEGSFQETQRRLATLENRAGDLGIAPSPTPTTGIPGQVEFGKGLVPPAPAPPGSHWGFDNTLGQFFLKRDAGAPTETALQKAQVRELNSRAQQQADELDFRGEQLAFQRGIEQQRIGLQQQQLSFQREESQRQIGLEREKHEAGLRGKPSAFLELAAFTGQTPAIQPWMIPLLLANQQAIQEGGELPLQPGQAIPGFAGDQPGFGDLPELIRPSRQYQAQIGPTALRQFAGFEQARTGAPIEEQAFRLGSTTAPGGRFVGLGRRR